ncbi:MAG: potassium uptake protein, TrkH family [Clostridiales bacterium]|nr:potassium uptake protein, TrkH family [Candidatus Coliplasma caballi]
MSEGKKLALGFAAIVLVGTALLMLPVASRDGRSCGLLTALFTATSSTCVTGLIVQDTWVQWSGFGQAVLLALIETGGLGFMSAASFFIFVLKKKAGMRQQMMIAQSIGVDDMGDLMRIQKRMLFCGLLTEAAGAMLLTVRFLFSYDFVTSLKLGVFHSISAFCNAGFDILGFETPGQSLIPYGKDPFVCITLALLIILGGIGFLVWDELIRVRSPKKWSVYTKLVLGTTAALLLAGTVLTLITEWDNPATLGTMNVPEKINAAFFQSATLRTAGFAGIDQGGLTEAGKGVSIFFMLIGGSSGSTAGGLKTVTFVVLVLFLLSRARGKKTVSVSHRTIPDKYVLDAITIFGIMVGLLFAGAVVLCATTPGISFSDALYETTSAIATVGLTTGITPTLSVPAKLLLILYMYFGRVGVLTISLGFLREKPANNQYQYAHTNLLIG